CRDHQVYVTRALARAHHVLVGTEVVPQDQAAAFHQPKRVASVALHDGGAVTTVDQGRVEKPVGVGACIPLAAVREDLADALARASPQVVEANHPVGIGAHALDLARPVALTPGTDRVPLRLGALAVRPSAVGPALALEHVDRPHGGVALLDTPQDAV